MAVVDLDAHRPIWSHGFARCACGRHWVAVHRVDCDTNALECPGCGAMTGAVIDEADWQRSRAPAPDNVIELRTP